MGLYTNIQYCNHGGIYMSKMLSARVDDNLAKDFKKTCIDKNVTLQTALKQAAELWIQQNSVQK